MSKRGLLSIFVLLSLLSWLTPQTSFSHVGTQLVAALVAEVDHTVSPDPPGGGIPPAPVGCLPGASGTNGGMAVIHPDWDYCATLTLGTVTGTYEGATVQANYDCEASGTVFANPIPTALPAFDGTFVCGLAGPPLGPGAAFAGAPPAPAGAYLGFIVGTWIVFIGTFTSVASPTDHTLICTGDIIGGGTTSFWVGECTIV